MRGSAGCALSSSGLIGAPAARGATVSVRRSAGPALRVGWVWGGAGGVTNWSKPPVGRIGAVVGRVAGVAGCVAGCTGRGAAPGPGPFRFGNGARAARAGPHRTPSPARGSCARGRQPLLVLPRSIGSSIFSVVRGRSAIRSRRFLLSATYSSSARRRDRGRPRTSPPWAGSGPRAGSGGSWSRPARGRRPDPSPSARTPLLEVLREPLVP